MREGYPSDISQEQFEDIRGELDGIKKKTHTIIYDIFCAVLYLVEKWVMS